jgi:ComF family protein
MIDKALLNNLGARLVQFIFPILCPICSREISDSGICSSCWGELQLISTNACQQCGVPFAYQPLIDRCGNCLHSPPDFDTTAAAMVYGETSKQLILALKYGDRQDIAPVLAAMMLPKTLPLITSADLVMPLPLHPTRFFKRRFNQSAELCRHMLKATPNQLDKFSTKSLIRVKKTPSQGRKTRRQRIDMMRGAFRVPKTEKANVDGRHILLIDDVLTTGASLSSAAKALKQAGAKTVSVSVAARVC